jgi:hypothetical protein
VAFGRIAASGTGSGGLGATFERVPLEQCCPFGACLTVFLLWAQANVVAFDKYCSIQRVSISGVSLSNVTISNAIRPYASSSTHTDLTLETFLPICYGRNITLFLRESADGMWQTIILSFTLSGLETNFLPLSCCQQPLVSWTYNIAPVEKVRPDNIESLYSSLLARGNEQRG